MVVQYDLRRELGLARHVAVLRHCIEVLSRRMDDDAAHAWLWQAKLKAALFGLRMLEGKSPPESSVIDVPLRADELQKLDETHPLLQDNRPSASSNEARKHTDWYRDLQERVRRFARELK